MSRLEKQAELFGFMNKKALDLADRRQPQPAMFLDIGCGSGALMQGLPYKHIVGIDKDPDALALARERLPKARFVEADTDSGDFPGVLREILSGKPVIARLSLALHKLSDPVGTMRMLRETLPSGSVLLLLSPDQEMSCAYPGDTFERLCELWREAPGRPDMLFLEAVEQQRIKGEQGYVWTRRNRNTHSNRILSTSARWRVFWRLRMIATHQSAILAACQSHDPDRYDGRSWNELSLQEQEAAITALELGLGLPIGEQ